MSTHFQLGRVVGTPGALALLEEIQLCFNVLLNRHASLDWGDLGQEDKEANDRALIAGSRVMSAYHITPTQKVWIITEADRSSTTILLPEEY